MAYENPYQQQFLQEEIENMGAMQPQYNFPESQQLPQEIIALELNFTRSLKFLEHKLKGETEEWEGKRRTWKKTQEAWMNAKGVSKIISIIQGHVDVNTFLTYLMPEEIDEIMMELSNEVTTVLANKGKEFDIDNAYLGIVQSIIINTIYFALKRASGALTLKQIHGSTHRIENIGQMQANQEKEKRSILGRIF